MITIYNIKLIKYNNYFLMKNINNNIKLIIY